MPESRTELSRAIVWPIVVVVVVIVGVVVVVVVVVKVIFFVATKASAGHLSLSRYEASPQPFNVIVFLFGRGFIHRSVAPPLVHLPLHGTD